MYELRSRRLAKKEIGQTIFNVMGDEMTVLKVNNKFKSGLNRGGGTFLGSYFSGALIYSWQRTMSKDKVERNKTVIA